MAAYRSSSWLFVLLAALIAAPAPLMAMQPTPVSGDTTLYIDHFARLTARIPAHWDVQSRWSGAVGAEDGFASAYASAGADLADACNEVATVFATESAFMIEDATWNGEASCRVEIPDSILGGMPMTAMVMPHPEPFNYQGETYGYGAILTDPGHFDEILSTVSFDLSSLTGPQIAHSILDSAEGLSFYAGDIDWPMLRAEADAIGSPDDVGRFVERSLVLALAQAGDMNAFLVPDITADMDEQLGPPEVPSGDMRGSVGYLVVPMTALPSDYPAYVDAGFETIGTMDAAGACGWIIDLRGNSGGHLGIMLQTLTPFFPEGRIVGFVDAAGNEIWVTRDGDEILYEGSLYGIPDAGPVPTLDNPDAPIAVLMDQQTASAGEMTVLGLMTHPGLRTFGQQTAGFLGVAAGFPLLDGSTLILGTGAMLDADGAVHTAPLQPDDGVLGRILVGENDDAVVAAEEWLLEQPSCQDASPVASPVSWLRQDATAPEVCLSGAVDVCLRSRVIPGSGSNPRSPHGTCAGS